jgi:hypothetical protein
METRLEMLVIDFYGLLQQPAARANILQLEAFLARFLASEEATAHIDYPTSSKVKDLIARYCAACHLTRSDDSAHNPNGPSVLYLTQTPQSPKKLPYRLSECFDTVELTHKAAPRGIRLSHATRNLESEHQRIKQLLADNGGVLPPMKPQSSARGRGDHTDRRDRRQRKQHTAA